MRLPESNRRLPVHA